MMKTALTILLMAFGLVAQGQSVFDTVQYKSYADSTGNYAIKYVYNPDFAIVPSTYPEGKAHHSAVVTVFEIDGSDTTQIFQPLRGYYVEGDCVCYQPAKIITRYKELQKTEQ